MLNLDTYIVVAVLKGDLREAEERLIAGEDLAVSGVVLWELATLVRLRRVKLDLDSTKFREFARTLLVFPITLEIARTGTQLDFSSDPVDEIIAATSIVEQVPLLTRDARIPKSRLVPLALP